MSLMVYSGQGCPGVCGVYNCLQWGSLSFPLQIPLCRIGLMFVDSLIVTSDPSLLGHVMFHRLWELPLQRCYHFFFHYLRATVMIYQSHSSGSVPSGLRAWLNGPNKPSQARHDKEARNYIPKQAVHHLQEPILMLRLRCFFRTRTPGGFRRTVQQGTAKS